MRKLREVMSDVLTGKQRSYNMSRIRGKDTKPEIRLRRFLRSEGVRGYRINSRLEGRPDLVFAGRKIAVFVDGCFWHRCPECYKVPETNRKFWSEKIEGNVRRDRKVSRSLRRKGWCVIRLWEHELGKKDLGGCCRELLDKLKTRKARLKSAPTSPP